MAHSRPSPVVPPIDIDIVGEDDELGRLPNYPIASTAEDAQTENAQRAVVVEQRRRGSGIVPPPPLGVHMLFTPPPPPEIPMFFPMFFTSQPPEIPPPPALVNHDQNRRHIALQSGPALEVEEATRLGK